MRTKTGITARFIPTSEERVNVCYIHCVRVEVERNESILRSSAVSSSEASTQYLVSLLRGSLFYLGLRWSYYFPFPHFSTVTSNGEPMKIDEYVPAAIPMMSASEKCSVDGPPTK